jgi:sugar lactone lactonase YvrE
MVTATTGIITTVAGNGTNGFSGDGGPATQAQLSPYGLSVDNAGNLFISDISNNVIREVEKKTGIITTVAGNHAAGGGYSGDGGAATSAQLAGPNGVFVDSDGNLFIADTANSVVRKVVKTTGNIATVAGNHAAGAGYSGDNGAATSAQLHFPRNVFVDSSGNLFIADSDNSVVRKVTKTSGNITTVAGIGLTSGYTGDGGPATSAELKNPNNLFVEASGNILICDNGNLVIREVSISTGNIQTIVGNGFVSYAGDGFLAVNAALNRPLGVYTDRSGNIFVADAFNNVIREIVASTGVIQTVAGNGTSGFSGDGGPATKAQLNEPFGIFVDNSGNIFFTDANNSVVREVVAATGTIQTVAGTPGKFAYTGDGGLAISAQLNHPDSVFADHSGNLFIADSDNNVIRKVDAATKNITTIVGTSAQLNNPGGIFMDAAGNLFIADALNEVIREVDSKTGQVNIVAGTLGVLGPGGDNGPATSAQLNTPTSVFVDSAGNLFISDTNNSVIRKVDGASKIITTVAGTQGNAGYGGDGGPAINAAFGNVGTIALGPSGTLLLTDGNSSRVRSIAGLISSPWASLSPAVSTVHFGDQIVGVASIARTLTITNSGTVAMAIGAVAISGTNSGDFAETDTCANITVAPNGTCTLTLTFKPLSATPKIALLTVSNAGNGPLVISMDGNGVAPVATLSDTALAFGSQLVSTSSTAKTLTLTNDGNAPLSIASIAITGTNSGDFTQTNTCGTSVAKGTNCAISVTFMPTAVGARSGAVTITDNASGSPQTISLTGAGISVSLALSSGSSATQTVKAGQTATYNFQLSATGGAVSTDQVSATISCTGAPTGATCNGPTALVVATPATPGAFQITVKTTGSAAFVPVVLSSPKMQHPVATRSLPLGLLALLMFIIAMLMWTGIPAGRARFVRTALSTCLVLLSMSAALLVVGCGGGSSSTTPTPTGTYTLTVTATVSGKTQSTQLTLIVQ